MLEIIGGEAGIWIPERVARASADQAGILSVELGEALVPLAVAEQIGLKPCLLSEFDPEDPFVGGGLVWRADQSTIGCPLSSALGSVREWPTDPEAGEQVLWIGPDAVSVERLDDRIWIREKWGSCETGTLDFHLYREVVSRAQEEYKRFVERVLAAESLVPEERSLLEEVI